MIKIDMKATGKKILELVTKSEYSAKDLSIQLNVDISTPYYWFGGASLPKWETMFNLAEMCKCDVTDFFVFEDEEDETDEQNG